MPNVIIAVILFASAMALSIAAMNKHGQFLVGLAKSRPDLAASLDWNYFGDGASKRGYEIMVFFFKRKYEEIHDPDIKSLGDDVRRFSGYSIVLAIASLIVILL